VKTAPILRRAVNTAQDFEQRPACASTKPIKTLCITLLGTPNSLQSSIRKVQTSLHGDQTIQIQSPQTDPTADGAMAARNTANRRAQIENLKTTTGPNRIITPELTTAASIRLVRTLLSLSLSGFEASSASTRAFSKSVLRKSPETCRKTTTLTRRTIVRTILGKTLRSFSEESINQSLKSTFSSIKMQRKRTSWLAELLMTYTR
jgi:hypothetical protein